MNHQEIQEVLPFYVLGGLDNESTAAVQDHLAAPCEVCVAELREWQEVTGLIPLGFVPDGPSPVVKERLMARVRQDLGARGRVVPFRPRGGWLPWITLPVAAAAALLLVIGGLRYQEAIRNVAEQTARAETVTALLTQEREKLTSREAEIEQLNAQLRKQYAVAAGHAQALAQLETVLAEQQKLVAQHEQALARAQQVGRRGQVAVAAYEREIADLQAKIARQREAFASKEREVQELRAVVEQQRGVAEASAREATQLREALSRQRQAIEVLSTPELQLGQLRQAKRGVPTQGHVIWNERKKTWLFYAFGLPQPPEGKEYQVWFMTEREGPVSAGLFVPDQTGTGSVLATSPAKLSGKITAAAVTLEPAGGLPKPSGEMYLRGSL